MSLVLAFVALAIALPGAAGATRSSPDHTPPRMDADWAGTGGFAGRSSASSWLRAVFAASYDPLPAIDVPGDSTRSAAHSYSSGAARGVSGRLPILHWLPRRPIRLPRDIDPPWIRRKQPDSSSSASAVPEPGAALLFAAGTAVVCGLGRGRNRESEGMPAVAGATR